MVVPKINSSHGSETRNIINAAIDAINVQGKSIQDLVAEGQLTPEQYGELLETINGLVKSGQISKRDLDNSLRLELESYQSEIDTFNSRVDQIVTTPVDGSVSQQEIIDARQGEASVSANITSIKNEINNHEEIINEHQNDRAFINTALTQDIERIETPKLWEMGTLTLSTGLPSPSMYRMRSIYPMYVEKGTILEIPENSPYKMIIYMYENNNEDDKQFIKYIPLGKKYNIDQSCYINIVLAIDSTTNMSDHLKKAPIDLAAYKYKNTTKLFGDFELGTYNVSTGVKEVNNTRIRSKDEFIVQKDNFVMFNPFSIHDIEYALYMFDLEGEYIGWTDWRDDTYHIESDRVIKIAIRKKDQSSLIGYEEILPESLLLLDLSKDEKSNEENKYSYLSGDFDKFYVSRKMEDVSSGSDFVLVNSSHTDIYSRYDNLMNENPGHISKKLLGHATGVDGNPDTSLPIYEYHFKNPMDYNNLNQTPKILILNGVHGGEKSTIWSTLKFFENMFEFWREDETLEALKSNIDFKVIPILNPAGYNAHTRKNARGVDLNRNFSYKWGSGSSDPENWEYKGESAFSELETQIAHAWMEENVNAFAFIDYHNTMHDDIYSYMTSHVETIEKSYSSLMKRFYAHWMETYGIDISQQTRQYLAKDYFNSPIASNQAGQELGIRNSSLLEICQFDQAQGNKENTGPVIERGVETLVNFILMLLKNRKY